MGFGSRLQRFDRVAGRSDKQKNEKHVVILRNCRYDCRMIAKAETPSPGRRARFTDPSGALRGAGFERARRPGFWGRGRARESAKQNRGQVLENKRSGEITDSSLQMISRTYASRSETFRFAFAVLRASSTGERNRQSLPSVLRGSKPRGARIGNGAASA